MTSVLTEENKADLIELGRFVNENESAIDSFLTAHGVAPSSDKTEKTMHLIKLSKMMENDSRSFGPDLEDEETENTEDDRKKEDVREGAGILGGLLGGVAGIFTSVPASTAVGRFLQGFFRSAAPPDPAFVPGTPEYEARLKQEQQLRSEQLKQKRINILLVGGLIIAIFTIAAFAVVKATKSS